MSVARLAKGARGRVQVRSRQALAHARAKSDRTVNCPPAEGIGLGNMLYFLLWAHAGRRAGLNWRVRSTSGIRQWCEVFPRLEGLLVEPEDVAFLDHRVQDWSQDFHKFPPVALPSFVTERLLPSQPLRARMEGGAASDLTINVRRGDYYSVPEYRARYGFDIPSYVRDAVQEVRAEGAITRIRVVTDDPGWCRENLCFLEEVAPVSSWGTPGDALADLAALASSRRLVLANSSFSYWGAFLSNGWHGDNHGLVWTPNFHERGIYGGLPYHVDPRWHAVEVRDGGGPHHA